MRRSFLLAMAALVALAFAGCAKKGALIEPGAGEGPSARTETVTEERSQQVASLSREDVSGKYIEDVSTSSKFDDIYFDFDEYSIKDGDKPTLNNLSSWLMKNDAKIIIEGHCDERGTDEYNLGLGDRRANAAKQYLVASGVSPSRIDIVSFGEEKPQCSEKTESCWSKNRRGHFVLLMPK